MRIPKRGERGFTLVELLIVLAILAVLAAVVIPNVTGMFGRGAEQAWETDVKTIQTGAATFYFDLHDGAPWQESGNTTYHYYPTEDGLPANDGATPPVYRDKDELLDEANLAGEDFFLDGGNGAIWMGLLVNSPGAAGDESPAEASTVTGEKGPYLNEVAKSCSSNNGNTETPTGSYTWVVCKNGKVHAFYWDGTVWEEGFSGTYP